MEQPSAQNGTAKYPEFVDRTVKYPGWDSQINNEFLDGMVKHPEFLDGHCEKKIQKRAWYGR